MHKLGMFDRSGTLSLEGFENSGADFMPEYKKYIHDGKTVVASPHKVYGPEQNDVVLQLRKRGVDQVILAGMSANLCVESHLRELLETGFEVAVVKDATAAKIPDGDGVPGRAHQFPLHCQRRLDDGRRRGPHEEEAGSRRQGVGTRARQRVLGLEDLALS